MRIVWNGHSCFTLESNQGTVVLDPYQPDSVPGLAPLSLRADLALCSHGHRDHNAREAVQLTGAAPALQIQELHTFHDPEGGALRGENTIHVITAEGLRVAHLGDLGCWPEPELLEQLRDLDALLIPVGGYYTVDAKGALNIMDTIHPNITIPMHYLVNGLTLTELASPHDFLARAASREYDVSRLGGGVFEITKDNLKKRNRIVVMECSHC